MAASDGLKHRIRHRLGIHADPVRAVAAKNRKFFRGDGVRPAGLDRAFTQPGKVEGRFQFCQQTVQLRTRQRRRRTAAHIQGDDPKPRLPNLLCHSIDLAVQRFQERRNHAQAFLGRLADKAAVGTSRRAEGNPDIQADVLRLQQPVRLQRRPGGIQAELRPLMRNVIAGLKLPKSLLFRKPGQEQRVHQLSRPHARQSAPDRFLMSGAQDRTVYGKLDNLLAKAVRPDRIRQLFVFDSRPSQAAALAVTVPAHGRREPRRTAEADLHPPSLRFPVRVYRFLPGEQRHQHLLGSVPVLMSFKIQFHIWIISEPGRKHNRKEKYLEKPDLLTVFFQKNSSIFGLFPV